MGSLCSCCITDFPETRDGGVRVYYCYSGKPIVCCGHHSVTDAPVLLPALTMHLVLLKDNPPS